MRRRLALATLLLSSTRPPPAAGADSSPPGVSVLVAVGNAAEVAWLPDSSGPYQVSEQPASVALLVPGPRGGVPVPATAGRRYPRLGVLARGAGHFDAQLGGTVLSVDAVEVRALDHREQPVDPQRSHASMSRSLPSELGGIPTPDHDALSFLLIAPAGVDLGTVEVLTRDAPGRPLDVLPKLRALPATCPEGTAPELVCRRTPPLRLVGDALDRTHPAARERTLVAQVAGTVEVFSVGRRLLQLLVGGPRETRLGPIERLRAHLRPLVLRARARGAPALGGDDAGAKQVMERELASAAALWAQCGIELGAPGARAVQVVDPPSSRLLAIGCAFGQVASGGDIEVRAGRRFVKLTTRAGETPSGVGRRLAEALERARLAVSVFENQRTSNTALATVDLLLGASPHADAVEVSSSDPTLPVCLGQVDLSDGLTHFGDGDAFSGTIEERTLLRAFDDGDPRSIEVLVVPSFARSERIGESFISSPGSSLSNTVIIDRAAVRAGARSFALAHELGHVLLAMPGHPDDFGVDQSFSLMDADVADATIFGPRRLSVADCERAVTQTGPDAFVPLLEPVPLRSAGATSAVRAPAATAR